MEQLKSFWGSSSGNKAVVVVSSLLIVCGCCAICGALSSLLPNNSSNAIPAQIAPTKPPLLTSTPLILVPTATAVQVTAVPTVAATDVPPVPLEPTATIASTVDVPVVLPTEAPVVNGVCDCSGPDLDCKHFATHADAQTCYDHCKQVTGGDVFRLDGSDKDDIVCENLP